MNLQSEYCNHVTNSAIADLAVQVDLAGMQTFHRFHVFIDFHNFHFIDSIDVCLHLQKRRAFLRLFTILRPSGLSVTSIKSLSSALQSASKPCSKSWSFVIRHSLFDIVARMYDLTMFSSNYFCHFVLNCGILNIKNVEFKRWFVNQSIVFEFIGMYNNPTSRRCYKYWKKISTMLTTLKNCK